MSRSARGSFSTMGSPTRPDLDLIVDGSPRVGAGSPGGAMSPPGGGGAYSPVGGSQSGQTPAPNSEDGSGKGKGKSKKERRDKEGNIKPSQRPSWSCTECTRRKIKCDKVVPGCSACVRRGKVAECRLDDSLQAVALAHAQDAASAGPRLATTSEYEALTTSLQNLRQQLWNLENVVNSFAPHPTMKGADGKPLFAYPTQLGPRRETALHLLPSAGPSVAVDESVAGGGEGRVVRLDVMERGGGVEYDNLPNQLERLREQGAMAEDDGEVEAAVTLEYLALGRDRKADHFSRASIARPADDSDRSSDPSPVPAAGPSTELPWTDDLAQPPHPSTSAFPSSHPMAQPSTSTGHHRSTSTPGAHPQPSELLPDRALSDAIIQWSLDRVGWQHGPAVHPATFEAETRLFFNWGDRRGKLVNQAWLALYFAVLCVGVKHMGPDDGHACGLSAEDLKRLPRVYFDAAVESLHRSNFLAKHSVYAVQTIVILVVACQDIGGSDLIQTLLSTAIRIAQHLQIHAFRSDEEWDARQASKGIDPRSEEGIKALINREVRKRLWCVLASEDWVSVSVRRSYAIFPSHCTTPLPTNCLDGDLARGERHPLPMSTPTPVAKILLSYKIAACVRRFFEDVNAAHSSGPSYDRALQVDREIREILKTAPAWLRDADADVGHLPAYVAWVRHYWPISTNHKIIAVHRVFLGRSFKNLQYAYSRKAAIEAARTIVAQLKKGRGMPYQQIWTVPYHAIVAATTLVLDVFQGSTSDGENQQKRQEVQDALAELTILADNSDIARRGVQMILTLLTEEAKHRRPHSAATPTALLGTSSNKRAAGEGPLEGEARFGQAAKRVAMSVNTPRLSSSPSLGLSPRSLAASGAGGVSYFPSAVGPGLAGSTGFSPTATGTAANSPQLSDGQLTQDVFDQILISVGAYAPPATPADGADAAAGFAAEGLENVEFWHSLDSTFGPMGGVGGFGAGAGPGSDGGGGAGDMFAGFEGLGQGEWDSMNMGVSGMAGEEGEAGLLLDLGAGGAERWG